MTGSQTGQLLVGTAIAGVIAYAGWKYLSKKKAPSNPTGGGGAGANAYAPNYDNPYPYQQPSSPASSIGAGIKLPTANSAGNADDPNAWMDTPSFAKAWDAVNGYDATNGESFKDEAADNLISNDPMLVAGGNQIPYQPVPDEEAFMTSLAKPIAGSDADFPANPYVTAGQNASSPSVSNADVAANPFLFMNGPVQDSISPTTSPNLDNPDSDSGGDVFGGFFNDLFGPPALPSFPGGDGSLISPTASAAVSDQDYPGAQPDTSDNSPDDVNSQSPDGSYSGSQGTGDETGSSSDDGGYDPGESDDGNGGGDVPQGGGEGGGDDDGPGDNQAGD
jgi:hypothetical protein